MALSYEIHTINGKRVARFNYGRDLSADELRRLLRQDQLSGRPSMEERRIYTEAMERLTQMDIADGPALTDNDPFNGSNA